MAAVLAPEGTRPAEQTRQRISPARSKLNAASVPFSFLQPDQIPPRFSPTPPSFQPHPYQNHAHHAPPPVGVNGGRGAGFGAYGQGQYSYDGYGQQGQEQVGGWMGKQEPGPSQQWAPQPNGGYYPPPPRQVQGGAHNGGIYFPQNGPHLHPALLPPFDQHSNYALAPPPTSASSSSSASPSSVPAPRRPKTRRHRPPPPAEAAFLTLGPNAKPPPNFVIPSPPPHSSSNSSSTPPPTDAPAKDPPPPAFTTAPPVQPPPAPPPIVPASPPTLKSSTSFPSLPTSPQQTSEAKVPLTPVHRLAPLPYASLLATSSTPARDLSTVSTTATAASSVHSSPILIPLSPLSPTTTTTTIDSEPPSIAQPSSPSAVPAPAPSSAKRSWADLLKSPGGPNGLSPSVVPSSSSPSVPGSPIKEHIHRPLFVSSVPGTPNGGKKATLAQTLEGVEREFAAPTMVPRGLINNGNLCFTNAILQVLVYTTPFWNLLMRIRGATVADFSGKTPSMDAMIHFLEEFRPAPKVSVVTRHRSKSSLGGALLPPFSPAEEAFISPPASDWSDPFVPEEVYNSLKPNKRFDAMRRGHQEDAEEFLGFFLDTLHDEVLATIDRVDKVKKVEEADEAPVVEDVQENKEGSDEWLEVGSKGRTATTRTTETRESPITRIFGGQLRSVLRCSGQKDSITLEPYQRLQLDIQPPHVRTVEDALANLTLPEHLPDFVSAKGLRVEATKQVYLETFPPVLILHLKRFLYDNVGGVQKCAKVIGYGTELVIKEDIIAPTKRTGEPVRYQLYGVVYHHGKSAAGGHYTVAVRQQINSNSWVHIDDTSIEPISPGDVAVERPGEASGKGREGYQDKGAYLLCYRLAA